MIKSVYNAKIFSLKTKIINVIMVSGKKTTAEKVLLNFAKKLQKLSDKNFKKLVQLAIINSTPIFKLNEQIVKKGKRKAIKNSPSFITADAPRVMFSLKSIKYAVIKSKNSNQSYAKLANEILLASDLKGHSVDRKTEMQKRILLNKRYLSKFHW
jgi:ribosomal protein S7